MRRPPLFCLTLCIFLFIHSSQAQKPRPAAVTPTKKWLTLTGAQPAIIARGGFSGVFPYGSPNAIQLAQETSLNGIILLCDLQFTKDSNGLCLWSLQLDNTTNIDDAYPHGQKPYNLDGRQITGWFPFDYTIDGLSNVALTQNYFSRPDAFDGMYHIAMLEEMTSTKNARFWLNVEYNSFYVQQRIDPIGYVSRALTTMQINFISCPEIGFLKAIKGKLTGRGTQLIFRFQGKDKVEPTTKQTYGSLVKSLVMIKEFASGILVPKDYIWPVGSDGYLQPPTTLVNDAHRQGLSVYAYIFTNDNPGSYNYSYDPTAEYLKFIDDSQFCVDGMVTDFPSSASEAIACFVGNMNAPRSPEGPLIISYNGAGGSYPPCTDLAYEKAISDGADIIDCSVQMTKDGIAFCMSEADLTGDTTASTTFMQNSVLIPEIQQERGIFSFDLTWSQILTLKPQLESPYVYTPIERNPAVKNKGSFMTLSAFLDMAKTKAVKGVLISIFNAPFLASKRSLSIIDAVNAALSNASLDKQVTQKVIIQSDDTQVLAKFKSNVNYETVLRIEEPISNVPKAAADEIKKYASSVAIPKTSILKSTEDFIDSITRVVDDMHAANISVYVHVFRNEYVAMPFDYLADPMIELATFIGGIGVDGVITEFPGTADKFLRSPCANPNHEPYSIYPAQPNTLLLLTPAGVLAPTPAPAPSLTVADVVDPPLPSLTSHPTDVATGPSSGCTSKFANLGRISSYLILSMAFICISWFN